MRILIPAMLMFGVPSAALFAQEVVSTKAGLVHYTEGEVFLGEKPIDTPAAAKGFNQFQSVKPEQVLRTGLGRAELLLSPGLFLRLAEDSAVRMIDNRLEDIRLELVRGSVLLEAVELLRDTEVSLRIAGAVVRFNKSGLYRMDLEPAQLKVYDGAAEVIVNDQSITAKKAALVQLQDKLMVSRFDTERGDPLHRWSARRASYLALANVSAAKSVLDSGSSWRRSGWVWNPYFGMMTFIPVRGGLNSPFGYSYFCPNNVTAVYAPRMGGGSFGGGRAGGFSRGYDSSLGYDVSSQRTYGGYSPSTGASGGGAVAAAPAPVAESPRSAESATPRGGEGGGRGQ